MTAKLWEVFVREGNGLAHKHIGSVVAINGEMALQYARDVYARRNEIVSIWVVESTNIVTTQPDFKTSWFESSALTKPFRYADYYQIPAEIKYL